MKADEILIKQMDLDEVSYSGEHPHADYIDDCWTATKITIVKAMEQYAELRIQQERKKWKEELVNRIKDRRNKCDNLSEDTDFDRVVKIFMIAAFTQAIEDINQE